MHLLEEQEEARSTAGGRERAERSREWMNESVKRINSFAAQLNDCKVELSSSSTHNNNVCLCLYLCVCVCASLRTSQRPNESSAMNAILSTCWMRLPGVVLRGPRPKTRVATSEELNKNKRKTTTSKYPLYYILSKHSLIMGYNTNRSIQMKV